MPQSARMTRRSLLGGLSAVAGLALVGCGSRENETSRKVGGDGAAVNPSLNPAAMTVYRDPNCGCCEAWAGIARKAGYEVDVVDHADMTKLKSQYGVPEDLQSCHTTVFRGYVIEGHVPIEDVTRLVAKQPRDIRGIAVPGMPAGSPGMEVPGGKKQPFKVMAFNSAGAITPFRA